MKSNIDLTSNEMFSRKTFRLSSKMFRHRTFGVLDKTISYTFPWLYDFYMPNEHHGYSVERQEIVFTGNRKERTLKNLCKQEYSGDYCDCCGIFLKRMPWNKRVGLCKECDWDMERRFVKGKHPWL